MLKIMGQSIKMLLWMTLLTGFIYPGTVLLISYLIFPDQAQGSFIKVEGKVRGSKLIGQKFASDRYFWPRPSMSNYNPLLTGASNLGPTSKELKNIINKRKELWNKAISLDNFSIPSDLLFASGSGLDPHITPDAAYFQIERVSNARSIDRRSIAELIDELTEKPTLRVMGASRVNVLLLNQKLDEISQAEITNE